MIVKKIFIPIIITIVQLVILWIIHSLLYAILPMHHRSIGFGMIIIITGELLLVSLLFYNFYLEFKNQFMYQLGIVLIILSSFPAVKNLDYRPYRSLLLILLSFSVIVSSVLVKKIRDKKKD